MRKVFLLSLLVLLLELVPIHRTPAAGTDESNTALPTVTLEVLWWGSPSRHDRTLRVLDLYSELRPQVAFEPVFLDWNGYWDALYVMAAAEDMPDVFQTVIERLTLFQHKDLLVDLEGIETLDLGAIEPSILDLGRVEGELVGVCLGVNSLALGFHRELFDRAGVAPPNPFWRWRDLREASLDLRSATGVYGLNGFGTDNDFHYWIRSQGGQLFSEDLRGVGWRSDEDVSAFYRRLLSFQSEQVIPPAEEWAEGQQEEENSMFAFSRAGMRMLWSNKVVSVHQKRGTIISLARPPGLGSRQGLYLRPAMFFSIASSSRHKAEAGRFVSYFLLDNEANRVLGAERGVPVVESVRQAVLTHSEEQTQQVFYYINGVSRWSTPMPRSFPPVEAEYRELFDGITREVAFGRLAADEAPAVLRSHIEGLLQREGGR